MDKIAILPEALPYCVIKSTNATFSQSYDKSMDECSSKNGSDTTHAIVLAAGG